MKRSTKIASESLDRAFDAGKDISRSLDTAKARRPLRQQRRVNVDFPSWMIDSLDREAGPPKRRERLYFVSRSTSLK